MTEQPAPNVGQRIRALREQRGLSLRALAEGCKLSINAISRIERNETSPTVSSLHQLAIALRVPITEFFQEEHSAATVFVRANQRMLIERNGVTIESLGIGLRHQRLEPFLITMQPGAIGFQVSISHPGQEFVHCLEGQVEYSISDKIYWLEAGDSLLFESYQPHNFRNRAEQLCRYLLTIQAVGGSHIGRQIHLEYLK